MPAEPPFHRAGSFWVERVHGEHWPTMLHPATAALMTGLQQLAWSQWLAPQALIGLQLRQAWALLRYAASSVPFYQSRLPEALLHAPSPPSMETWRTLPILTRQELISAGESIVSTKLPAHHGQVGWTQTSGSTGEPVRVLTSSLTQHFWSLFVLREQEWHLRELAGTLAVIRPNSKTAPPPAGAVYPDWGAFGKLAKTGPAVLLDISAQTEVQLAWLGTHDPHYLLTFPTNLAMLLEKSAASGFRPGRLKEVQTIGEPVPPELREACRQLWSVPLVDAYSSQEVGYMGLQCPRHDHLHVQAENVLLEVLDESGQPCPPGVVGRIVVTALHNFATPLIRYDIGDRGELGPSCPCGRGLPVLTRIVGRSRDMVILPSGGRHWPLVGVYSFRTVAQIRQYQIVQESLTTLRARLVVDAPLSPLQEQALAEVIGKAIGHPFVVVFEYPTVIERTPGGKYREFICAVEPAAGP